MATPNRRGTTVSFVPDPEIFGEDAKLQACSGCFKPRPLEGLPVCRASRSAGNARPSLASADVPAEAVFQFPGGLADHLTEQLGSTRVRDQADSFSGSQDFPANDQSEEMGRVEWAIAWPLWSDGAY